MKYHIVKITKGASERLPEYLAEYSSVNFNEEIWSTYPEDWREFGKLEAKGLKKDLKSRGIEVRVEKDLGI